MGKQTIDVTKAAALYMLKNGLASYKEISELSGRSQSSRHADDLVAGSIPAHLAIGGVREGAIMLGIKIALGSRCPPARLAMQAPVAGLPAFVGTNLGIRPGWLEEFLTFDASHLMLR
jgi:hypothetical protein